VATVHLAGAVPDPPVRVVVVAATLARGGQLERLLAAPGFAVVGVARGAEDAERLVALSTPAAVLVDLDLAEGGLEAIERIMANRATPIVVVGDAAGQPEAALAAGAVDVVGPLDVPPGTPDFAEALRRHLKMASRVAVITHPRARLRARSLVRPAPAAPTEAAGAPPGPAQPPMPAGSLGVSRAPAGPQAPPAAEPGPPDVAARRARPVVVAIGASTGGPPALATILRELPAELDAVVLVVQHMAEGFLEGLARWLDEASPLRIQVAVDGDRVVAGTVYLAPAGRNMLLRPGFRIELVEPSVGQFHVPGVDATFHSVARVCGGRAVGALLTGMGRDGAVGLRAMREAGAVTIGQDESTSVVYGMPAAAKALEAVDRELPLTAVAPALVCAVEDLLGTARAPGART
jgi:two-component system, chemotaxis family, protein-glutamate methylesterase/glutaminase